MIEIMRLVMDIRQANIALWVEQNKLKFSAPDESLFESFKQRLLEHKSEVIALLLLNNIVSQSDFKNKSILKIPRQDQMPLSFAQERLWFIEQYEEGTSAYHIPVLLSLSETVDLALFKKSITSCIERHDILKTVFQQDEKGKDYQIVIDQALPIQTINLSDADDFTSEMNAACNQQFDLSEDYPIRVNIYHVSSKTYVLIIMHHIASDGWSVDVFQRELGQFYQHYLTGQVLDLPALDIQYQDFAIWQRQFLQGDTLGQQLSYWRESLVGHEPLNLPTDKPRLAHFDYQGKAIQFNMDLELSEKVRQVAQQQGCTLYVVLLTAFYILLNKYTGQHDVVVGTPVANRHYYQIQNLVGFFVNSLALRSNIDIEKTALELLEQVEQNMLKAQGHQDLPFEKLVEELALEKDLSRHPIFQVLFSVQGFGQVKLEADQALFHSIFLPEATQSAKFDIELLVNDALPELRCHLTYAASLYYS